MSPIRLIGLRDTPLSVDEVQAAVMADGAGGIALFAGAVRDHDHDRAVTGLTYSAHPSAEAELRRVAEEVIHNRGTACAQLLEQHRALCRHITRHSRVIRQDLAD